jgi:YHS domain-containing protein
MRSFFVSVLLLFASSAAAEMPPIFSDGDGAIRGYDPVAYFIQGKPLEGSKQFTHQWRGAHWRFASAENRDRFAAMPNKYAPQYGGYCAYGVAQGYAVKIEPEAWSIVEGRLYLNYSVGVQGDWKEDIPGYISKANANWPQVLKR